MIQDNKPINSHIAAYLDYYCGLSAPGFAVLLKGQWGCGKTWFIDDYCKRLKKENQNQKCLYVSLYGMTTFAEIEDTFFQQLHPILSSKGMAITGKIIKGLLRASLRIDLDRDGNDDDTVNPQIPEINIPEYLRNTDKTILVFDDLERCNMDISNILGYINYFVEHQGLKVIIVANEDELIKDSRYKNIKEKLIGITLGVSPDFNGSLNEFVNASKNLDVQEFMYKNHKLIEDLYQKAEYDNLRTLKQIILDFERIFNDLPENAKNKQELLQDILRLLMVFSIEIKRGTMLATDIRKLKHPGELAREQYISGLQQPSSSVTQENSEEKNPILLEKYPMLNLHDPFPNKVWWETFFDKGIIDGDELEQSLSNSRYFQDENTPTWKKLWYFEDLNDDEFDKLLKKVESEYADRKFLELGVIKHVTGLFLKFSDVELYYKSKEDILNEAKLYIDRLKDNNPKEIINGYIYSIRYDFIEYTLQSYDRLGYQGKELNEFQEFCSYIDKVRELVRDESMPSAAQELLDTMQNDVWKFYEMICSDSSQNRDVLERYYEIPILKYIKPAEFVKKLFSMKNEDQRLALWMLPERYKSDYINEKVIEELEWLKSVRNLLIDKANRRKSKLSGYRLESLIKKNLNEAIQKLEATGSRSQINL